MLTCVEKFVILQLFGEPLFNLALHGSRDNWGMVDRSIVGWVSSRAFRVCRAYDGVSHRDGKVLPWEERLKMFAKNHRR